MHPEAELKVVFATCEAGVMVHVDLPEDSYHPMLRITVQEDGFIHVLDMDGNTYGVHALDILKMR